MKKAISLLLIFILVFATISVSEAISITKSYNTSRSKDHFYLVLQVSDEGTLYYALSTVELNLQSSDLINPTNESFISSGSKVSETGGTQIEIQIDNLSPDVNYEFYAVFKNTPGDRSNIYHETINSVNYINSISYDGGNPANSDDDKIIINLNRPYTVSENTMADLKIGNLKTEVSSLASLYSGTDFTISQVDSDTISFDLNSQSVSLFDDETDWANAASNLSSIYLYDSSSIFGIGDTYEFNFDMNWISHTQPPVETTTPPKLISIAYDNQTGFSNDAFSLTFDKAFTIAPDNSNITVLFDDEASGSFVNADYNLSNSDFSVTTLSPSVIKISLTQNAETTMKQLKHGTVAKVILAPSGTNTIEIDQTHNSLEFLMPGQNPTLSVITVNGLPIGVESGKFDYTISVPYTDYAKIISGPTSYISYESVDSAASFNISQITGGVVSIYGTSADGLNNSNYNLTINSLDVRLSDIMVNGISLSGFTTDTLEYRLDVDSDYQIPTITWIAFNSNSEVLTSFTGSLPGVYEIHLTVKSEQSSRTYKLIFETKTVVDEPNNSTGTETNQPDSTTDTNNPDTTTDNPDTNANEPDSTPDTPNPPINTDNTNINDDNNDRTQDTTTTETDATTTVDEQVDTVVNTINLLSDIQNENSTALIESNLQKLDKTIKETKDEKEIAKTAETLSTLAKDLTTKAVAKKDSSQSTSGTIKKVGEYVEQLIVKIDDPTEKITQIENFTKSIKEIKNSELSSKDLDKIVDDIVSNTSKTMSKVIVEAKKPVGPLQKYVIDSASVDVSIKSVVNTTSKLNQVIGEYFGEDNYIQLKKEVQINIDVPKEDKSVQIVIDKGTVSSIKDNEINNVNIKVDSSELTLDSESLDLSSDYEFVLQRKDIRNETNPAEFAVVESLSNNKRYVDVNLFKDGNEVGILSKPATLTFDIDYFGYEDDEQISELSIYKFDEETDTWEAVGGIYDPQTKTISVKRIHLSKYTVMKTKKTISGVGDENLKGDVQALLNKGVIKGDVGDMQANITREEFITWLGQSYGLTSNNGDVPFTDLDPSSESYKFIASVYEQGIITGKSATNLGTSDYVTYEEVAVILANTLTKLDNKKINNKLTAKLDALGADIEISDWAKDEVALVIELGYMDKSVAINSKGYITREQAAAIFNSFYS